MRTYPAFDVFQSLGDCRLQFRLFNEHLTTLVSILALIYKGLGSFYLSPYPVLLNLRNIYMANFMITVIASNGMISSRILGVCDPHNLPQSPLFGFWLFGFSMYVRPGSAEKPFLHIFVKNPKNPILP